MSRRTRKVLPTSMPQAMHLCLEHARIRHNRSVERVADLMGLPNPWVIYKWMSSARLPAILIRPFEHACGASYVTEYLATSAHKLLIDIPRGVPAKDTDLLVVHEEFTAGMTLLARFYRGEANAEDTIAALSQSLTSIASHRANVAQHVAPELALFEGDEE